MEYHSNRFIDFSLLCYSKNKLIASFPANIVNNTIYSHGGLTFGGLITNERMTTSLMLDLFTDILKFYYSEGIDKLIYKPIPYIYHKIPAQEDLYALFINNAKLIRRDVTTTILLKNSPKFQERRKRSIKKAKNEGLKVILDNSNSAFIKYWKILENNLLIKYNVKPVHSIDEIIFLKNRFPENIKMFLSYKDDNILAGVLVFENENIAHSQYISSNEDGRKYGALDLVFDYLINEYYINKKYFDFGISNEDEGRVLNKGLIAQKEGFGARAVVQDFYEINL